MAVRFARGTVRTRRRIRDFLRSARQRDEASRPRDVIVYYIGHGFFDDQKSYFLALHSLRPDAPGLELSFQVAAARDQVGGAPRAEISDPGRLLFRRRSREWMSPNADAQGS